MSNLDRLIKSIDRLVELNEMILLEIRGGALAEPSVSKKQGAKIIDAKLLGGLMSSAEVKLALKISDSTLTRMIRDEIVIPVRIGRSNRFDPAAIEAMRKHYLK
ncbi:MAG TPA: helix-turn-helix domain-containing protein [Sphingobacteriaceae bacterium]